MQIVNKRVDELIPYINNPRKNDNAVDKVASSIKNFGFKVPIIIDKGNEIVAGHTRLKAALKLGLEEVPCIVADDLTPAQIKAFRIADNRVSQESEWDWDKLKIELEDISSEFDYSDVGFDANELDKIDGEKEVVEDDYEVELPDEPKSKYGDIYQLGNHRLMCGDSTKEEDVKKLMNVEKADMLFTDPPYNVDYEGAAGKIMNDNMEDNTFYHFLYKAFENMFEHTKPGGAIYVCHADTEGLNFRNAFKNAGYKLAECLIWVKNALVFGRQDYQWQHEPILYGWKPGAGHYFVDDRTQSTTWFYDKSRKNDLHPTMKPLELVGQAIANSSRVKEIVLDLFGGSGSTMVACEQLNRKCYMMELDPKYVDVIINRWEKLTGKVAVKIND